MINTPLIIIVLTIVLPAFGASLILHEVGHYIVIRLLHIRVRFFLVKWSVGFTALDLPGVVDFGTERRLIIRKKIPVDLGSLLGLLPFIFVLPTLDLPPLPFGLILLVVFALSTGIDLLNSLLYLFRIRGA